MGEVLRAGSGEGRDVAGEGGGGGCYGYYVGGEIESVCLFSIHLCMD